MQRENRAHVLRNYQFVCDSCVRSQSESMMGEMSMEALEIVTSAVDKFLSTENYEVSCTALP